VTILEGLTVVELPGQGAAGWAGKHFADWGARVIVLERPEGSALREQPPYYTKDGRRQGALWQWLSRGKAVVRVGAGAATSVDEARALCARADVVVAEAELTEPLLGIAPSEVRPHFEGRIVFVLISPFATDGPYAGYRATDLGVASLGGWTGMLGEPHREPLRPGSDMLARVLGVNAFAAGLIGHRHRLQGGPPSIIDLSGQAMAASLLTAPWLVYSLNGQEAQRRPATWPSTVEQCKDGWAGISPLTAQHWELLCRMLGLDDVLADPAWLDPRYRLEHGNELLDRVRPWYEARTRQEIYTEAQQWRLPAGPVDTVDQRLDDPQLHARGFFVDQEIDGRRVRVPRVPYLLSDAQPVERAAAVEEARVTVEPAPDRRDAGAPQLPFEGIRVVDLTWFWSGPHTTMTLGALGADVIKVEAVQRPDSYRYTAVDPTQQLWYERGALWNDTNQNKRGLTLNLNDDRGMRLFEGLLREADVVISNFSNRVLPNLGLTVERFHEINPRLIVVLMPGFGADGPWGEFVGYGVSFEQITIAQLTGYADSRPTINGGFSDPLVGAHTIAAITLALANRERTGRGSHIEVPQCETLDSLLAPEEVAVQHGAPTPTRKANHHEWMAPHNVYRVAGDDEWLSIAVASDAEFAALAGVIEAPDLAADERFATVDARKLHEAELDEAVAAAVRDRDLHGLEQALQAAGVMACRVTKPYRLTEDEGLRHIGFFQTLTREVTGTHPYKKFPFRFSAFDLKHRRPAPLLGEHNEEILTTLLGVGADELAGLAASEVIGTEPIGFHG
jgi:crotonobetainyl-CoA:carnitine CoA-transferase CaiB-like acyl-CoA transferase